MFKPNDEHRQSDMFSTAMQLPEKRMRRLEESWAATFYRDFFCRIDETICGCLYSDQPSRPNVPVNVLIGFEVLKAGHGWSDEQAYDAVCFNLQVRHALGLNDLAEDDFSLRTVYNFRRAVADYAASTGENLFEAVFEQVTGEQQVAYEIGSTTLRMDSTQIASNIRNMSRLQLLVEVIQRMQRELDEPDKQRLEEVLAPYTKSSAGQYAYRMRGHEPRVHLLRIGRLMAQLLDELEAKYAETNAYCVLRRVFRDHFFFSMNDVVLDRFDEEISAQSMQSPDDPEATFRSKARKQYRGYVGNVTETCDEANDAQLIVDVVVESNSVDDGQMLVDIADELKQRTGVETLYTDGGYNGPKVDEVLADKKIELIQTSIRGGRAQGLGREDFDWKVDDKQKPVAVGCPGGQRVDVEQGRKSHTFMARFDEAGCSQCPLLNSCPTEPRKRRPERVLRFTATQVLAACRVRRSQALMKSDSNPRAAVEATIWSVEARFPRGRVPYRGQARVTIYTVASAAMTNVCRLAALVRQRAVNDAGDTPSRSFGAIAAVKSLLAALQRPLTPSAPSTASQRRFAPARCGSR